MKKRFYFCNGCIVAALLGVMMLGGCKGNKVEEAAATGAADSDSVVAVVEEESVPKVEFDSVIVTGSDQWMDYNVKVVMPVAEDPDIQKYMRQTVLSNFGVKGATGEENIKQAITDHKKRRFAEAKSDLEEMFAENDFDDDDFRPKYSYEDDISVGDITDGYVTFENCGYDYRAGAHGMPWQFRFTADRATGKQLKWADIIKISMKTKLKPLLKKAVLDQYFNDDPGMLDSFDLPGAEPALTPEGVWFGWGAYEIACFAAGMPECIVPYDKLQDYLTDYVKEVIAKSETDKASPKK
ncbi:MAG: hypothetical protein J5593_06115 [Bacteroidaceae bacterium]|nr:hypothetical protein [Bacteroidaceae bacterium]